ncbi:hypothetical protein INR49_018070 [Caranx melampygus]|nr:hypothetical protein INR49_018070 [Caranx melampygus]
METPIGLTNAHLKPELEPSLTSATGCKATHLLQLLATTDQAQLIPISLRHPGSINYFSLKVLKTPMSLGYANKIQGKVAATSASMVKADSKTSKHRAVVQILRLRLRWG